MEKTKSKDFIKGFKHGIRWAILMAKCNLLSQFKGTDKEWKEYLISLDTALIMDKSVKKAIKSLKEGR